MVVLASDFEAYARAIAQWTDTAFFPVLFQDDLYAPKFIAAFKPAEVLVLNPTPQASRRSLSMAPTVAALRRTILASWTDEKGKASMPAQPNIYELRHRLEQIGAAPLGVVFGDGESGEMAGALALAAGRFQPLEYLTRPVVGAAGQPGSEEDYMSLQAALAMGREIRDVLRFWGLSDGQRWAYVTLAGKYPYRYVGPKWDFDETEPNLQFRPMPADGSIYATEDLLGRDDDLLRIAVCGRLMGDYARSSYQAMCSLFLQPESGLLFNTAQTDPKIDREDAVYRMDRAAQLLSARLSVTHMHNEGATLDTFRAHSHPWNKDGLVFINASGWPERWKADTHNGQGDVDDFPIGAPTVVNMVHSGSAAELYQPETIAHRSIWGGAYWYFGSSAEPFLSSFQPLNYAVPRMVRGVPLAAALRMLRTGKEFYRPWRLMLVGDPQFCLREQPAVRRELSKELRAVLTANGEASAASLSNSDAVTPARISAEQWANHLRFARWKNAPEEIRTLLAALPDGSLFNGVDAVIVIEEFLKADKADAAVGVWNQLPADARKNYTARTYARYAAGTLMDRALASKDLKGLLTHFAVSLSTEPAKPPSRPPSKYSIPGPNYVERWNNRALALARELKQESEYLAWLGASAADERLSANRPFLLAEAAKLKARIERDSRLHKDWLILGPFRDQKIGAWENVGPKAGQTAPDFNATFTDGKPIVWKHPFKPGDRGIVDLCALLQPDQNVYAYAAAEITADRETAGALLLGSDDGVTAWLDGKEIHRNPAVRGITPDEDKVPLKLVAGRHSLVLRIDQHTGGWAFCARFVNPDGNDVPGVILRCPADWPSGPRSYAVSAKIPRTSGKIDVDGDIAGWSSIKGVPAPYAKRDSGMLKLVTRGCTGVCKSRIPRSWWTRIPLGRKTAWKSGWKPTCLEILRWAIRHSRLSLPRILPLAPENVSLQIHKDRSVRLRSRRCGSPAMEATRSNSSSLSTHSKSNWRRA